MHTFWGDCFTRTSTSRSGKLPRSNPVLLRADDLELHRDLFLPQPADDNSYPSGPALFGIATVALLLGLRKPVGDIGVLAAAALLAVSPAVYFSRDFIHEALLVFFTLSVPVTGQRYRDTLKPTYLMLASAAAALMFATKETAAISALVLLLALLCTFLCSHSWVLVTANADRIKTRQCTVVAWRRTPRSRAALAVGHSGVFCALRALLLVFSD